MLKLRTMAAGSDPVGAGTAVGDADPRVTRVGAVLRRTSLDEVPNLVNVLRGEMSLVGPRPTIPAHLPYLHPHQHRRHAVRPGITGWAQVNGRVGITWGERIELDNWYVENRSPVLDLRILGRTVSQVVGGRGPRPGMSRIPGYRPAPMTSERGSEVEVRIRPFRPDDWRGGASLVQQPRGDLVPDGGAAVVRRGERQGLDERASPRTATSGEDRKWAIEVEGIDEPVGFTALYGLFRQTAPELGALIGDDPGARGRRPGGRAPDRRQGLRGVRRPPRLRADPGLQRARQEGGHLAGLAARGHDARAHPPPRRDPDRLRDLGHLGRRLARALVGRRRPGELDRRGRADRRRGRGGRRDRRLLPQPRVLRRRGGHSHARRRRRLEPRLRPVARPRRSRGPIAAMRSRPTPIRGRGSRAARSIRRRST